MKFTKGYWLNLPGVTNTDAVQVREVKVENDRVYLYTVPYHADMRAMGGPLLEMYISSPQPDIIRTEAYHFMGSNQKMPAFELNDAHCALEVENTETTVTIKSGNTKLVIGKNPCVHRCVRRGIFVLRHGFLPHGGIHAREPAQDRRSGARCIKRPHKG